MEAGEKKLLDAAPDPSNVESTRLARLHFPIRKIDSVRFWFVESYGLIICGLVRILLKYSIFPSHLYKCFSMVLC